MRRRAVLCGCVGVAGSLAGCAGILGDGSSNDDAAPTAVATDFLEALFAGDTGEADSYVHAESRMKGQLDGVGSSVTEQDTRLVDATLSEKSGNAARIDVQTTVVDDTSDSRVDSQLVIVMRRVDGEWRVELLTTPGFGGGGPTAPSVVWETTITTEDDAVTAVVFEHNGGDTVAFGTLSVAAGGATAEASTTGDVLTGSRVVVPFDGDGEPVDSGTEVELRWTDGDSESTQVLTAYTLGTDAIGSLGDRLQLED